MKALVMQGGTKATVVTDRAIPKPRPGYLLVKVAAVALNPTDWKHVEWLNHAGCLVGCDYSGTVAAVGTGYARDWKEGTRICGMVHGGNKQQPEDGAFAEYIQVRADVQFSYPPTISFPEASTLGLGILTAGQGLYQGLKLSLPKVNGAGGDVSSGAGKHVLVYGGSTASGALGIQLLKLSGYVPITTCSKRNFDYVKSIGAAEAFDYRDPDCAEQISKFTDNTLQYAWDCISLESSVKICADALCKGDDIRYGCLLPVEFPRKDVKVTHTLAYTAMGDPFDKGGSAKLEEGDVKDFEWAKSWVLIVEQLLMQGKIKPHRPDVRPGGLEGVLDGLNLLKNDTVSGQKLVYELA